MSDEKLLLLKNAEVLKLQQENRSLKQQLLESKVNDESIRKAIGFLLQATDQLDTESYVMDDAVENMEIALIPR